MIKVQKSKLIKIIEDDRRQMKLRSNNISSIISIISVNVFYIGYYKNKFIYKNIMLLQGCMYVSNQLQKYKDLYSMLLRILSLLSSVPCEISEEIFNFIALVSWWEHPF